MNFFSVCSGIDAASVAWNPIGWKAVGFSEIEKFPSAVLAARFPEVNNFGDMNKYKEWSISDAIDVLVGGTPCQSFSVAGLRKGMDDPRGNLAIVYCGILAKFSPKWFVWENVPGVLSSGGGRDFGSFLGAVAKLGYGFAYRVLDAQFFGVPQRRRRVFVIGCLGDWRSAAAVLFEPESVRRNTEACRSAKKEIAHTLRGCANSSNRADGETYLIAHTCLAKNGPRLDPTCETFVQTRTRTGAICANGKAAGSATSQDAENGLLVACTLSASDGGVSGGSHPVVAFSSKDYAADAGYVSPTSRSMGHSESHANAGGQVAISQEKSVRRLTPRECERLQGFPDDWTLINYRGKPACDGPRYKAIGNSMAVPVMRWIGERIQFVEDSGL